MDPVTPTPLEAIPPNRVDLAAVRALVEPLVAAHRLSLVDVEWVHGQSGSILRVTIERPEEAEAATPAARVTLEDCVQVSRDVGTALDAVDLIVPSYNLEVSSPGLDRPLASTHDFARNLGKLAKVKLSQPARDGQIVLRGTITAAGDDGITMDVDGNEHAVPLSHIRQARLVFEVVGQPKRGKPARKKRPR